MKYNIFLAIALNMFLWGCKNSKEILIGTWYEHESTGGDDYSKIFFTEENKFWRFDTYKGLLDSCFSYDQEKIFSKNKIYYTIDIFTKDSIQLKDTYNHEHIYIRRKGIEKTEIEAIINNRLQGHQTKKLLTGWWKVENVEFQTPAEYKDSTGMFARVMMENLTQDFLKLGDYIYFSDKIYCYKKDKKTKIPTYYERNYYIHSNEIMIPNLDTFSIIKITHLDTNHLILPLNALCYSFRKEK